MDKLVQGIFIILVGYSVFYHIYERSFRLSSRRKLCGATLVIFIERSKCDPIPFCDNQILQEEEDDPQHSYFMEIK